MASTKIPPLVYPFTFEEWKAHPDTQHALKWIKKIAEEIRNMPKEKPSAGVQLNLFTS